MNLAQATGSTSQHFVQAFNWMLIHSLWQGLLVAVVTAVILMLTKRAKASTRYNLVFVQFLLFVLACGFTFIWEWNKNPQQNIVPAFANIAGEKALLPFNLNAESIRQFANNCIRYFSANAPMVVLLWFILFLFRSVRMMGSMLYVYQAKRRYIYSPPQLWVEKVTVLSQKLHLKKAVTLIESGFVKVPLVVGHLKPIILMPVGMLAGLPANQVEAVLLHELAHIRRHDYFVNLLQTITETVFFFNPGLLWISSLLRDERENCCDDIALAQTKNKREFVQALISFKEHSLYGSNYSTAFPGKKNHLLRRVSRILDSKNKPLAPTEKVFFMAGILILSAMVATAAIAQIKTAEHILSKAAHTFTYSETKITVTPSIAEQSATISKTTKIYRHNKVTKRVAEAKAPLPAVDPASIALTAIILPVSQTQIDKQREASDKAQALLTENTETQRADRDRLQAVQDQLQAKREQDQARVDQEQARRDQEQAKRDQEQARLDQIQAKKDQEAAAKDQLQAKKDQDDARKNQQQTVNSKVHVQVN